MLYVLLFWVDRMTAFADHHHWCRKLGGMHHGPVWNSGRVGFKQLAAACRFCCDCMQCQWLPLFQLLQSSVLHSFLRSTSQLHCTTSGRQLITLTSRRPIRAGLSTQPPVTHHPATARKQRCQHPLYRHFQLYRHSHQSELHLLTSKCLVPLNALPPNFELSVLDTECPAQRARPSARWHGACSMASSKLSCH